MKQLGISPKDRPTVDAALKRAESTGAPAVAIQLNDGRIITGKTTSLLGASAALLLNALKELGGIHHDIHLISPIIIEPIQKLKVKHMGNRNPRLHTDEIYPLSICAATIQLRHLLWQLPSSGLKPINGNSVTCDENIS